MISKDPKPVPIHKPATVALGANTSAAVLKANGLTPNDVKNAQVPVIIVNPVTATASVNASGNVSSQQGGLSDPALAQIAVKQDKQEQVYVDAAAADNVSVGDEKAFTLQSAQIAEGTAPKDQYGRLPIAPPPKGSNGPWVYPPPPPAPTDKKLPGPLTRDGSAVAPNVPLKPGQPGYVAPSSGGNLTITALAMAAAYLAIK